MMTEPDILEAVVLDKVSPIRSNIESEPTLHVAAIRQ
jgi:hypothetical protein